MTDSSQNNKDSFSGDGTSTALPTTFPFIDDSDLVVTKRVTSTGVETVLTLTTHYTVTGGDYAIGEITPVDGATDFPAGVTWTIHRNTPKTQATDYVENDNFGSDAHENALDKLTYLALDGAEEIDRALKVSVTDAAPGEIPNSVIRASSYAGYDAAGDPVALSAPTDTAIVTTFAETLLDDSDAVTARATLEAAKDVITTRGDLVRGDASGGPARLAKGSVGEVLAAGVTGAGDAIWAPPAPRGHLSGLTIARTSATIFTTGIGVARCGSSSDQDLVGAKNTNAAFAKVFDNGGWEDADGGGGVPAAAGFAAAIDTWHYFLLVAQDGSAYDYGWDTSLTAANLIADATVIAALGASCYYRKIHSFVSTATPNFADFTQYGDEILLNTPVLDYADVTENIAAGITVVLASVPDGVSVKALLRFAHHGTAEVPFQMRSSAEADVVSAKDNAPLGVWCPEVNSVSGGSSEEVRTDTSQQIFIRCSDTGTDTYIVTRGWIDRRGRDD